MRGAGCTWNDITDKDFDAAVARTKSRPIPSGTGHAATGLFLAGDPVARGLRHPADPSTGPPSASASSLSPARRKSTLSPSGSHGGRRCFSGIAFNWGRLAGVDGALRAPSRGRRCSSISAASAWTLFYDTIYAHQDTEDDALIGIKSNRADLFGEEIPVLGCARFLVAAITLIGLAVIMALLPGGNIPHPRHRACGRLGDGLAHGVATGQARHRKQPSSA